MFSCMALHTTCLSLSFSLSRVSNLTVGFKYFTIFQVFCCKGGDLRIETESIDLFCSRDSLCVCVRVSVRCDKMIGPFALFVCVSPVLHS